MTDDLQRDPLAFAARSHDDGWKLGQVEGAIGVLTSGATAYLAALERRLGRALVARAIVDLRAYGPHVKRAASPELAREICDEHERRTGTPCAWAEIPTPPLDPSTCSSCGAPIVWAVTVKGSRAPLDPDVVDLVIGPGVPNEVSVVDIAGRVVQGTRATEEARGRYPDAQTASGRVSHFATCPDAGQHRRARATVDSDGKPRPRTDRH